MGRVNFEQEFRQKLQDREIKPSEANWEKLQGRLDLKEKKRFRFSFRWLSVAACLAGGIFIWSLTFESEYLQQTPEIVNIPSEEIMLQEENEPEEQIVIASEDIKSKEEVNPEVKPSQKEKSSAPVTENTAIAEVEKERKASEMSTIEEQSDPIFAIEQDLIAGMEEVIEEVATQRETTPEVTDAEIDALLENAAAELALENDANPVAENIDAGSLLWEVEMELERSFRDKILDALKEGYLKTRTAVANQSF